MLITERKVRSESGAILILTAILATIILIFVAIVVDLSIFSNSQEQTQHYSRLAVLAALEQHFAETVGTSQERAVKAMARAREVTGRNFMLSEPSRAAGLRSQGTSASDPGALLLPGQYYFERPCNDPHDNTCNPCNGVYPCFVETDLTSDPDGPVTAYRVRGHLYDGIPTRFARTLFGTDTFPVEVFSTASVRPRQVIFLIDTSGSMTRETHFRRDPVASQAENPPLGHGSYFSFVTSVDNPTEPPRQDPHWTFLSSQSNRPRTGGRP